MMNKKKILFVCQYFYPETFRGNDIAFHLAEKGHDVHVVKIGRASCRERV